MNLSTESITRKQVEHNNEFLQAYASDKGLSIEFLLAQGIQQTSPKKIEIPYYDENSNFLHNRKRYCNWEHKFLWDSGAQLAPYGLWRLKNYSQDYIVLAEGETDSLTLWQNNIQAIGLPGANTFKPSWTHLFERFEKVYFWVEDLAGYKGALRTKTFIPELILIGNTDYENSKLDINEYFLKNSSNFSISSLIFNVIYVNSINFIHDSNNINIIVPSLSSKNHVCSSYSTVDNNIVNGYWEIQYSVVGAWRGIIQKSLQQMNNATSQHEQTFSDLCERILFYGRHLAFDTDKEIEKLSTIALTKDIKASQIKAMVKHNIKRVESGNSTLAPPKITGKALDRNWDRYTPTQRDIKRLQIKPGRKIVDLSNVYEYLRSSVNRNPESDRILGEELKNNYLSFAGSQETMAIDIGISLAGLKRHFTHLIELGYMQKIKMTIDNKNFWCWRLGYINEYGEEIFYIDSPLEKILINKEQEK